MDFEHDESWESMTTILASKLTVKEAWNKLIDFHEQAAEKPYWSAFRQLDIEAEQAEIVTWLQQVLTDSPMPQNIIAIWIGLIKFAVGEKEVPVIYFAGADTYDKDDIDWACDPVFLPENRYAQPEVLQQINDIAKADDENYEFLDWILPLAYCAFTFDEIIRKKLDKSLLPENRDQIFAAVGYDSGDYVDLSMIER